MRSFLVYLGSFVISFVFAVNVSAQDFSYSEFENETDPKRRVELGIESWNYYLRNNLDSLKITGQQMIDNSSSSLYPIGIRNLGSYFIRTDDLNKGIELLKKAKDQFAKLEMTILLSETENELGNAYYLQGNYNQASRCYLSSISTGTKTSDATAAYNGMLGFGKTLCAAGDTLTGLLFIKRYLEKCLRDEKYEAASDACGYLGMIAGAQEKIELMSAYYKRSINYARRSNSKSHKAIAYTNKAIDYFYLDKVDSANYFFEQSLLIRQEVGETSPIVESLYNLGLINIEINKLDEAKIYLEKGEFLADQGEIRSWQLDCLELLLEIANARYDQLEADKIEREMERIRSEMEKLGTLDEDILNAAIEVSAISKPAIRTYFLWELIAMSAIIIGGLLLMYKERPHSTNSTSADTPT